MKQIPSVRLLDRDAATLGRPFELRVGHEVQDAPEEVDEVASAHNEAVLEGYDEGLARAQQEMAAEVEAFRSEVGDSLKRIVEYERTFAAQHEAQILELIVEIASRIVRKQIEQGEEVAARAFSEALAELPANGQVRARLNPADVESVGRAVQSEIEAGRVELVADASIVRGGASLETALGILDATLETATSQLLEAVLGAEEPA